MSVKELLMGNLDVFETYVKYLKKSMACKQNDPEDLPFKKGDVLELISKDEKDWWLCRNVQGDIGLIPVPYVSKYDPESSSTHIPRPHTSEYKVPETQSPIREAKLPCKAVVVQPRIPNLYDKTQLKLEKGDIVIVTKMNSNGQWEGEINGRKGIFPFTHVKLDVDNTDNNVDGRM
ncbi:hypothetical protein KUTeg_023787 [Tegillarca granosa]|uniref:SH3 domain-containing protein n=1 Tax=Tegillarca granosa TaxID=220873 RepID=A0ABQ9E842_TEGGR|nr:hypothetical protein KUTeg_023787 [Tegillarca granosa]